MGAAEESPSPSRFEALTGLTPARYAKEAGGPGLARALLLVAAVRVIAVTIGLALAFLQHREFGDEREVAAQGWLYLLIGTAYGMGLVGTLALRQGRFLRAVAYGSVFVDAALVTSVVAMTGGVDSVFAFTYVLVILEGSVLLLRAGAWIAFLVSTVAFAAVLLAQVGEVFGGFMRPTQPTLAVFGFLVQTLGVGLVAFLASELTTKLRIAGRRLAEREEDLERLGELHATILSALPAGLLTVGPDGTIRYGNEASHSLLRLAPGTMVGRSLDALLPPVAETLAVEKRLAPQTRLRHETPIRLEDGTTVRLGYSFAGFEGPDGSSTIVVFQDVTEVVRLEDAVRRAERLALVGRFAAGLAHEVRNPLASMCASIEVLQQSLDPPPAMERLMGNVMREAQRLEHLIRDFLAFSRPRKLSFAPIDLSRIALEVVELFRNDPKAQGLRLVTDFEEDARTTADADLVRQVVWNLLVNAVDAMKGAGTLTVQTRKNLGGAVLAVADEGPGFGAEQLRRAADPFFTTKRGGSGLGLAISQSIMYAHGGELDIENRPEGGALVRLRFDSGIPSVDLSLGDFTPTLGMEVVPTTGDA